MMNLLAVVWDFDPVLFSIGGFEIRYYSLMWVAALLVGGWIFSYFCRKEGRPQELADSAFLFIALGTMIGARVGHCLFYEPEYYLAKPWAIITEIRNGGLASHGATIGIIVAIWLCSRKNKVPVMWMTDRLGVIAPISGALIRFGNLFNSEIIGHVTKMPWGFKFVRLYRDDVPVDMVPACHPTQLYEACCYLLTFALLWWMYHKTDAPRRRGMMFGVALIGIFLTRFLIEFVKVNQVSFEAGMTLNMGQWLSLPFVAIGVGSIIYSLRRPMVAADENVKPKTKRK
ncbi:MAG: prolipoprotein diacylglyceryl transferase [Alistipes sp.]|nr:prolipoprotein diacylglyceryl transferase [Alistipes sp.]MBR0394692.1 prolipoprotein diacylglyceryl transferase [Alistipes sp.]